MKTFSYLTGIVVLIELTVQNVLFAKQARIEPNVGLTVISGETGSGKSLLLGAMQLVLGGRASAKLVGTASSHALVTAVFEHTAIIHGKIVELAEEHGFPLLDDEPIILRRQISSKGRSQSWINDTPVGLQVLKTVGSVLVDVQGQHEPLRLSERSRQMTVLDAFAGNLKLAQEYTAAVNELRSKEQDLAQLIDAEQKNLKEKDYYTFLLEELDQLSPEEGEFEQLEQQQQMLAGAQEWRDLAQQTAHQINESDESIKRILGKLSASLLEAPDERLRDAGELCTQAESLIQDAAMICSEVGDSLQADPQALTACEERLSAYVDLIRKHGGTPRALLDAYAELRERLDVIEHSDERRQALVLEIEAQEKLVLKLGEQLSKKRRQAFKKLSNAIRPHLNDLGMPEAKIILDEHDQVEIDSLGIYRQEFLVQTNPGIAADRIGSVASGGEHARLALALALVLGDSDDVPVMVFDEIDSGVGARLGVAIGRKLATLAQSRTVVVITHTPQVAAMAQHHYLVRKKQSQRSTEMDVRLLEGKERHDELTEMLGGGSAAAQQAEELLTHS